MKLLSLVLVSVGLLLFRFRCRRKEFGKMYGRLFCRGGAWRSFQSKKSGHDSEEMCWHSFGAVPRREDVMKWVDISEVLRDGVL